MCVAKLADTTVVPKSNAKGHEINGQAKSVQDAAVSAKPIISKSGGPGSSPGRGSSPELCSWARHFTLTVPLSTQVYKLVPANLMLGK